MNNLSFTGHCGRDAEIRQVGDSTVMSFTAAMKAGYGEREQTVWISVSLWGKRGESLAPYVKKGSLVGVIGELSTREHEGKTYLQVRASDITLLSKRSETEQSTGSFRDRAPDPRGVDDDTPF